jgi:decaprenylphospho-beta-D-erythro-pentofuranosid-2-ulose 2-reductase
MSERLLIIGATSAIATAVARRYAQRGARIGLIARRADALDALAADLRVRGAAEVATWVLDANDIARHAGCLDAAWKRFDGVDHALLAHGVLPDQAECQASVAAALASFDTNARSVLALLTDLANRFERQGSGTIGVISSPAGDRGRASNYVYGAAKAAVTNLASGLRHRLAGRGVRVVTILPGFVDTPMTAAFPKGPLWATPERVADDIERALARGFGAVYTPWFWRWIMLLIRHVPERLFVRTRL